MVELKNLDFAYSKKKPLFRQLDMELLPGNIYGLLGRNGAGKTTLLKIMTGLVFPGSGSCNVLGEEPQKRIPDYLEDICFIPEEYHLPSIRIDSYVAINAPFYKRFDHDKLSWLLKEFELKPNDKLHQLSFGQKKKFLLAFGLSTSARLMLMDEPTNGLDIPSKSQFRRVLAASINDDQCVLISTHQVRDLENMIDPIIIIDEGKIIFDQSVEKITTSLLFDTIPEIKENQQPIYYEEEISGYAAIMPNVQKKNTRLNIELLFNGVIANTKGINEEFLN